MLDNTDTVSWADVRLIGRTPIDDIVHLAEILAEGEEKMKSVKPSAAEKYRRNSTADEENRTPEKEETPPQTALLHCSAERAKQETPKGRNKERLNGETAEHDTPKRRTNLKIIILKKIILI